MAGNNDVNEWSSRLTATETILNSLSEDIKQVAIAVKEVADANLAAIQDLRISTNKSISKLHENAESRANFDRTRVLSVAGITATVMLPIFGIIGLTIAELNDDVGQIRNFRVEDAYDRGVIAGMSQERVRRLDRLERQIDNMLEMKTKER